MQEKKDLYVLISIPWGDKENQIPMLLVDNPQFGFILPEQKRKIHSPGSIKIDFKDHIYACVREPDFVEIYHFDQAGTFLQKTRIFPGIENPESWEMIDFTIDNEMNFFLLESLQSGNQDGYVNRIRSINSTGEVLWSITKEDSGMQEVFHNVIQKAKQIIYDPQSHNLLLPAVKKEGSILLLDKKSGKILRNFQVEVNSDFFYINKQGIMHGIEYIKEKNKRALILFDPKKEELKRVICDDQLYGWLALSLGVDAKSNFFTYKQPEIARITLNGEIDVTENIGNIVIDERGIIYRSSYITKPDQKTGIVKVQFFNQNMRKEELLFTLPLEIISSADWQLIHVDKNNKFYILGGEEPGKAGTLFIFSAQGICEQTQSPLPDVLSIECRMAPYSSWVVNAHGHIYIPVTDSRGLKVLCLHTINF